MASAQDELKATFGEGRIPDWFHALLESPVRALSAVLAGRADLGVLSAANPEDVLLAWIRLLADAPSVIQTLDRALAEWIERSWGVFSIPGVGAARQTANSWSRASLIVANASNLESSARALHKRRDEAGRFLGALSTSRANDPLGAYLTALTRNQADDTLAPFWWALCDLPPGTPYYHGFLGVEGIRYLPYSRRRADGGFRPDVAQALIRLGRALERTTDTGQTVASEAEQEFLRAGRLMLSRFPFKRNWLVEFSGGSVSDIQQRWYGELLLDGKAPEPRRVRSSKRRAPIRNWPAEIRSAAQALKRDSQDALNTAMRLVSEQRPEAAWSGELPYFAKSLTQLAGAAVDRHPSIALQWASDAVDAASWDAFTWRQLVSVQLKAVGPESAIPISLEASARFPHESSLQNQLGHVLMRARRLPEARAVYEESVELFPSDPHGWGGLAEVLKHLRVLDQAEVVYRAGVDKFPENGVLKTGLAAVLRLQGWSRRTEALELVDQVLEAAPTEEARKERGRLLHMAHEEPVASTPEYEEPTVGAANAPKPVEVASAARNAGLLRRSALRQTGEARSSLLEQARAIVSERSERDPLLESERALVFLAAGNTVAAGEVASAAASAMPGSLQANYVSLRVMRSSSTIPGRQIAERWFDLSKQRGDARPVAEIEALRSVAPRLDEPVSNDFTDLLGVVDRTLESDGVNGFAGWWKAEMRSALIGQDGTSTVSQESVRGRLSVNSDRIDLLEERFIDRIAASRA